MPLVYSHRILGYKYAPFYNCTREKRYAILCPEVYRHENEGGTSGLSSGHRGILNWREVEAADPAQFEGAPWRFNELQRDLDGISQKVLTDSLRQMIDDGLAYRRDYQTMPPRVEYGLTELGKEMLPIIDALADFGTYYKSTLQP